MAKHALIIGGGVIGAACAHYLLEAGWKATIVERGRFAGGCSHANCGFVCPSHVLPLAGPGALGRTLRALLSRNSPLSIKPRLDLTLWSWLYGFARRCTPGAVLEAGKAIQGLLQSSRALYDELFQTYPFDAEWETNGLFFVFQSPTAMEHYAHTDELLRRHFGLSAKRYDRDDVRQLEPALKSGLAGGWHYVCDAHLRPDRLLTSWKSLLLERGATIQEDCEFQGFLRRDNLAAAGRTSRGLLRADAFVLAAGSWTPLLAGELGCRIPIQPGKGYSLTMPRPTVCPRVPLIFEEHRVAVTPMQSGYRLGSIMEFAGYDSSVNPGRLDMLRKAAGNYLQEPTTEPVLEQWYGWRPMTYDSKPIIDFSPAFGNVLVASGHSMLGLSMAPATGKLVMEFLDGRTPHLDPKPYSLRRFRL